MEKERRREVRPKNSGVGNFQGGEAPFHEGEWGKSSEFSDESYFREADSTDKISRRSGDCQFSSRAYNPYTGGQFLRDHYGIDASSWGGDYPDFSSLGPKGYKFSDQDIFDEVCHTLFLNPFVDASKIEVEVKNGIVFLKGIVSNRNMKKTVEKCVDSVLGVRDIFNQLSLKD